MRSIRWWFRVVFLGMLAFGLGAYLLATTPWQRWLGLAPDYSRQIAAGDHIVAAIYAFKAQRGLWPEYLDDLAPDFLPQKPSADWFYDVSPGEPLHDGLATGGPVRISHRRALPALSTAATQEGVAHVQLGFDFDPAAPAWRLFGGPESRVLRTGLPSGVAPIALNDRDAPGVLAELDRRLKREPGSIEHWRSKASVLMARGDYREFAVFIDAAARQFPDAAWPVLAKAYADIGVKAYDPASDPPAPLERFINWAQQHPAMTHAYYCFWLAERVSRADLAAAAVGRAIKLPIEVQADDSEIASFYLWDMARWALAQENWELAAAVTNAWEAAEKEGLTREQSYLPLRAAARLGQGNTAAARADLDALKSPETIWARNLEGPAGLRAAVARSDKMYRYDPGDFPPPYTPFEFPE